MNYHNIFCPLSTPIPFHSKITKQLLGCNQRQCAKSPQDLIGWTLYWQTNHWSQPGREASRGPGREEERKQQGGKMEKLNPGESCTSKTKACMNTEQERLKREGKLKADGEIRFSYVHSYSRQTWSEARSSRLSTTVQPAVGTPLHRTFPGF